jgi:Amt family ammonium transporter
VHGFNGAWGVLAVGLFADGSYGDAFNGVKGTVTGLFYGDAGQLAAQCIGIATNLVYVGVIGFVVFKLLDVFIGLRVDPEQEAEGLDQYEVAVIAYPDFQIRTSAR